MLIFKNVTKTFQLSEKNSITPINNVSFEIKRNELVIIIGRSGSGKSTLLNLAAGLVFPSSGSIHVNGKNLAHLTDSEVSKLRSTNIGFVFQFPSLLPSLTIAENISLPLDFSSDRKKLNKDRVFELLKRVDLSSKANMHPKHLSAGEQKRAVIARALFNEPDIILADEPTSDLDQSNEKQIMDMIRSLNSSGVTFVVVTHNLELLPFATTAYEMENGFLNRISAEKDVIPSG